VVIDTHTTRSFSGSAVSVIVAALVFTHDISDTLDISNSIKYYVDNTHDLPEQPWTFLVCQCSVSETGRVRRGRETRIPNSVSSKNFKKS
jgi:hypothetical protein